MAPVWGRAQLRISPLLSKTAFTMCCIYAPAFAWVLSALQDNINGNSVIILSGLTFCAAVPLCTLWLFPDAVRVVFENTARRTRALPAIVAAVSPLLGGAMVWLTLFSAFLGPDQALGLGYSVRLAGMLVTIPAASWFTFSNWPQAVQPLGTGGE